MLNSIKVTCIYQNGKLINNCLFIETLKGNKIFVSYDTPIIEINKCGEIIDLSNEWNYSRTTQRQLTIFLKNYVENLHINMEKPQFKNDWSKEFVKKFNVIEMKY